MNIWTFMDGSPFLSAFLAFTVAEALVRIVKVVAKSLTKGKGMQEFKLRDSDIEELKFCVKRLRALGVTVRATPDLLDEELTKTLGLTHGLLERIWFQIRDQPVSAAGDSNVSA